MKALRPRRSTRGGFTLLEILVVVLLIGLLIGVVGPNVWNVLVRGKVGTCKFQIRQIEAAIELYQASNGTVPDTLQELTEPDPISGKPWLDIEPLDPWGNDYLYDVRGSDYEIISYGKDGVAGGEGEDADISSNDEEGA